MKKQMLHTFFGRLEGSPFAVRYWDGEERIYGQGLAQFRIMLHKAPSFCDLKDPVLAMGEAYMEDAWDFEGPLDVLMELLARNRKSLNETAARHRETGDREGNCEPELQKQKVNIAHHYDLGNDFYRLWLDETMSYSCAYFRQPEDSLGRAQIQKIDHSLKKLQMKPGDRLLDIGSGWGWLILRAARQYKVKAVGITLSEEQYTETSRRIQEEGLEDLVEVRLQDYLELDGGQEQFDRVISIGMFEHVGREYLDRYLSKVAELLVPGGLSLLHSIMGPLENPINYWIDTYIFPGGYVPSLRETVALLPEHDFHLLHGESLRLHYARTLEHWYRNFHEHWDQVEAEKGRRFARMWELYLLACAANFRVSGLDIYQLLFSKGLNNDLQMTYDYLHQERERKYDRNHQEETIGPDVSE